MPTNVIDKLLQWIAALPGTQNPYGLAGYKSAAVLLGLLIVWLVMKGVLHRVGSGLQRYPFIRENEKVLKALRRALRYGLILFAGTYMARLFGFALLEKIFQGVLIVMLASPAKDVLIAALTYLEKNLADRTDNKVDDIIFDLLNRFSRRRIFSVKKGNLAVGGEFGCGGDLTSERFWRIQTERQPIIAKGTLTQSRQGAGDKQ